jgi:hypothetical protein
MKKSTKAVLLSALVFPGAGQIYLHSYLPGVALITASGAAILYMVLKAVEHALQIVAKIQSGQVRLDETAIAELLNSQPVGTENYLINLCMTVFIVCWLIAMIHSYWVGLMWDKDAQ